jgi:Rod binding domain-containing protein
VIELRQNLSNVAVSAASPPSSGTLSQEMSKIDKSAKDFESLLLGSWLQEAEHSFAKVPGTDEEENDGGSTADMQEGMAMQPLGEAMAASGGIGIAHLISRQLHQVSGDTSKLTDALKLNKSPKVPISRVVP